MIDKEVKYKYQIKSPQDYEYITLTYEMPYGYEKKQTPQYVIVYSDDSVGLMYNTDKKFLDGLGGRYMRVDNKSKQKAGLLDKNMNQTTM